MADTGILYRGGDEPWTIANDGVGAVTRNQIAVVGTAGQLGGLAVAMKNVEAGVVDGGAWARRGIWRLPKVSADVIAAGGSVNWDASEGKIAVNTATPASGDLVAFGEALQAGVNGQEWIDVDIRGLGTVQA